MISPPHPGVTRRRHFPSEGWPGLKNGGHADAWLAQQTAYDLWQARGAGMPKVTPAPLLAA